MTAGRAVAAVLGSVGLRERELELPLGALEPWGSSGVGVERRERAHGEGAAVWFPCHEAKPSVAAVAFFVRSTAEALGIEEELVDGMSGGIGIGAATHVRAHFVAVENEVKVAGWEDEGFPEVFAVVGIAGAAGSVGVGVAGAAAVAVLAVAEVAGDDEIVREENAGVAGKFLTREEVAGPLDDGAAGAPFQGDDEDFPAIGGGAGAR